MCTSPTTPRGFTAETDLTDKNRPSPPGCSEGGAEGADRMTSPLSRLFFAGPLLLLLLLCVLGARRIVDR